MAKGKISFIQNAPTDKSRVKDSWERNIRGVTLVYSKAGVAGSGFTYNCEYRHGDVTSATSTQSTQHLTHAEIEALPQFVEFASRYLSEL